MTASFVRTLLTGTVAGAAFLALLLRVDWRRYWVLMLIALTVSTGLLRLPYPGLWTPEVALGKEALVSLLAAFLGIQLVRHNLSTLASVLIIGGMGWMTCNLPGGDHWGYRGLAFVPLAAGMVLWATWIEMDHHGSRLHRLAVVRLRSVLAVQAVYCCSWELGAGFTGWAATAACIANCWLFFGVAREALNGHASAQFPEA